MHPKSSSEESQEAAPVDYLTRMDAGERPDPEEYLRGSPRFAVCLLIAVAVVAAVDAAMYARPSHLRETR